MICLSYSIGSTVEHVKVNIREFEKNGPVKIFSVRDLPGQEDGRTFDGFVIMIVANPLDFYGNGKTEPRTDVWKAEVSPSNSSQVILTVPANCDSFGGHHDETIKSFIEDEVIHRGLEQARNEMEFAP